MKVGWCFVACAFTVAPQAWAADAPFEDAQRVVTAYVKARARVATNHVCVVVDEDVAWVLWPEGHKAVLWEPGLNDLSLSRRQLDWRTDFVENERDLRGSTYLMTKAWLAEVRARCAREGRSFIVRR